MTDSPDDATWPRAVPGIGRELSPPQALACALRILAHEGWQENLSGHITWAEPGTDRLWANPWGLWWQEVRASDIVSVDGSGEVVDGWWDVTPAVFLHTELHRSRVDARIVIHNHPHFATLLACMGELPVISHQNSCLFDGEVAFVDEYDGTVETAAAGAALAARVGSASGILLANHGAIVTGTTIGEACYRAVTFERMCRFTVEAMAAGRPLRSLPGPGRAALKAELVRNTPDAYWDGAVRGLLRVEPDVLD